MSGNGPIGYPARAAGAATSGRRSVYGAADWTAAAAAVAAALCRATGAACASAGLRTAPELRSAARLQSAPGCSPPAAALWRARGPRPATRPGLLFPAGCRRASTATRRQHPVTSCRSAVQRTRRRRAMRRQCSMLRRSRGDPIRRATISATTCRQRRRAMRRPRPIHSSKRTIRLRCNSMITIPPTSAPRNRATARPTPTSTRCWPRRRSSRAVVAAA